MNTLIIDDNLDVLNTIALIFEALDHSVETINNPRHLLDNLDLVHQFDLIIMDIGMPEVSGYDLCMAIKDKNTNKPVIAHTGWSSKDDLQKYKDTGFDDVIIKPASFSEYEAISNRYRKRG
jgi:CheY-like chemotaxis protein